MKFTKQHEQLPVMNMDHVTSNKKKKRKHGKLLPNHMRCLIVGPSNCGKTNCMMTLLLHPNGLKYQNVYIYSKSLYQPKYKFLSKVMSKIPELGFNMFANDCDVISLDEAKPNSVFIFDDVACEKRHDNIQSYFCLARHKDIDSFYLCQTYAHIAKHLVRDNANFLCVFKQDDMNLKHIYKNHVNSDMPFKQFQEACNKCWADKYGFIVIDKDSSLQNGRYRKGFDNFIAFE